MLETVPGNGYHAQIGWHNFLGSLLQENENELNIQKCGRGAAESRLTGKTGENPAQSYLYCKRRRERQSIGQGPRRDAGG